MLYSSNESLKRRDFIRLTMIVLPLEKGHKWRNLGHQLGFQISLVKIFII